MTCCVDQQQTSVRQICLRAVAALYIALATAILFIAPTISSNDTNIHAEGPDLLLEALLDVVGPFRTHRLTTTSGPDTTAYNTSIHRRCKGHLACEFHTPVIEADKVAFKDGEVYLAQYSSGTREALLHMSSFFAAKPNHLPSCLAQLQGPSEADWIAGPFVKTAESGVTSDRLCPGGYRSESAYFLFPWEVGNAFHALNDNVLAVLASVILSYLTDDDGDGRGGDDQRLRRTLYLFNRLPGGKMKPSLTFNLLSVIFGEQHVRPARSILSKGPPRCLAHLTWGTTIKIFYRDSLVDLRRMTYNVLRHIVEAHVRQRYPSTHRIRSNSGTPRVVIVTRNTTRPVQSPSRKLSSASESLLLRTFHTRGVGGEICCDFSYVSTIEAVIDHFHQADICVGIHGAGLANCVLAIPGVVVVELQTHHGFGITNFIKLAHMAGGHYVFYDLRGAQTTGSQRVGAGAILPEEVAAGLVDIAIKLHRHASSSISSSSSSRYSVQQEGRPMNRTIFLPSDTLYPSRRPFSSAYHASDNRNSIAVDVLSKKVFATAMPRSDLREELDSIFNSDAQRDDHHQQQQQQIPSHRYAIEMVSAEQLSALRSLPGRRMFWVYLNPSAGSYDKASVLGPALANNYRDCVRLPYYSFRSMALGSKDCDSNVILRKRRGLHDAMLLNNFIQ